MSSPHPCPLSHAVGEGSDLPSPLSPLPRCGRGAVANLTPAPLPATKSKKPRWWGLLPNKAVNIRRRYVGHALVGIYRYIRTLKRGFRAWVWSRNTPQAIVDWRFTSRDSRHNSAQLTKIYHLGPRYTGSAIPVDAESIPYNTCASESANTIPRNAGANWR